MPEPSVPVRRDLAVGALALALVWAALRLVSGFDGLSGQDPHEYLRCAGEIRAALEGGPRPGPFHWPPLYPVLTAVLSLLAGLSPVFAAQAVCALSLLGAFLAGGALLARGAASPRAAAVYWGIGFALAPFVLRASFSSGADLPGVAFLLGFALFATRFVEEGEATSLALAAACAAATFGTRRPAALVILPAVVVVAVAALRRPRAAALAGALLGGGVGLLPTLLLGAGGDGGNLHHPALEGWSLAHVFSRRIAGPDGVEIHRVPTFLFALSPLASPGFFPLGAPLLLALRKGDLATPLRAALGIGFAGMTLFHFGVPYHADRHLLAGFPLVPLLLYPAFERALLPRLRRLPRGLLPALLALAVAGQLALTARAGRGMIRWQRLELAAAELLQRQPATTLYTFALAPALPNRGIPQRVVDLHSGEIADAREGDLLLFAPELFRFQWAGRTPMTSWETLSGRFRLEPLGTPGGGWTLWRLEKGAAPVPAQQE